VKLLAVVAAAWWFLVAPAAAQSDPQACVLGGGPHAYQQRLTLLMEHAEAASREALGAQFTIVWLSDRDQGWVVGLAPGPLDLQAARDAIAAALGERVSGDDLATLTSLLHVKAQPYSRAELERVQDEIVARLEGLGAAWALGIGCEAGDAFRVEVELFNDATPEQIAQAREITAPYGDIVRFTVSEGGPPAPALGVAPPRLRTYVAFPRACVTGPVRITTRRRGEIRRLTVTVAGERRTRQTGRLGKPVVVRPAGERTRVTIAVRLRDGRYVKRTVTLPPCR